MYSNLVSIDWLQFCGKCNRFDDISRILSEKYQVNKSEYGNKYYKNVLFISLNKEPLFTIMFEPHSRIIDSKEVNVRIDNRLLYDSNLWTVIDNVISSLYLYDIHVTRVDLCNDFNLFANGQEPKEVIFNLANHIYRKIGKAKFALYGIQTKNSLLYNGVRYGVHGSEISVYLYNKSLEMKEKVNKPYIVERWLDYGLDVNKVWRLEISLMPKNHEYTDKESGELFVISLDTLRHNFITLFYMFCNKHFRIIDITKIHDSNISRAKPLDLLNFANNNSSQKLTRISKLSNSTTYDKGIINYLSDFENTKLYEITDLALSNEEITILKRSSILLRRLLHIGE